MNGEGQFSKKERSHEEILSSAASDLRRFGLRGASVQRVMKSAGKTVGGFYAHFASKEALVIESLQWMTSQISARLAPLRDLPRPKRLNRFLEIYLSTAHRDQPEKGCHLAALAVEVARESAAVRKAFSSIVESLAEERADMFFGKRDEKSKDKMLAMASCYVGALVLSRATKGTPLSERILDVTREFLKEEK